MFCNTISSDRSFMLLLNYSSISGDPVTSSKDSLKNVRLCDSASESIYSNSFYDIGIYIPKS